MKLRSLVAVPLALAALFPAAAMAKPAASSSAEAVRQMQDPRNQGTAGAVLCTLYIALMTMPADPFVQVMEATRNNVGARAVPKGATLGDLAGADARRVPGEIRRHVPVMMNTAGSMLGALEQLAPHLEAIGTQIEKDLGDKR